MSVKRFCDRCGREIGDAEEYARVEVHDTFVGDPACKTLRTHSNDELCTMCRKALDEWFKAGKGGVE